MAVDSREREHPGRDDSTTQPYSGTCAVTGPGKAKNTPADSVFSKILLTGSEISDTVPYMDVEVSVTAPEPEHTSYDKASGKVLPCDVDDAGRLKRKSLAPRRLRWEAELAGQPIREGTLSRRKRAWLRNSIGQLIEAGVAPRRARALATWSLDRYGNIDVEWLKRGET